MGDSRLIGRKLRNQLILAAAQRVLPPQGLHSLRYRHPNTHRPLGAGRNTGKGPNYASVDFRLTKRLKFGEDGKRSLELMFEGFNVFNRVNYSSVNNIVGTSLLRPPYDVQGRADRKPTDPLGFASALDPRQLQLGLRLNF